MQPSERRAVEDILMNRAPDQDARDRTEAFITETLKTYGRQTEDALRALIGAIYDGLQYGNWPWTFNRESK